MILGEFGDCEGVKPLGFFHGHFDLVVQPLHSATGKLFFRQRAVKDPIVVAAQGFGHLLHRFDA